LIPDGRNFKCTMMIEYPDPEIRKVELRKLKGVEEKVYVQVEGREKVWAIADEDLERENEEKTSSVHFMRFELDEDMAAALKYGVALTIGVDHPAYNCKLDPVPTEIRASLVKDLT
jgi:microcompartment protein CcmL/EutN